MERPKFYLSKSSGMYVSKDVVREKDVLVSMRGIVKRFPGVLANDHVNFELCRGEVHALLGENGAGKTTLMNVLYGVYQPDEGEIFVEGQHVVLRSPKDAIRLKISMIHQSFMQIPSFTVTENVVLGLRTAREPLLDIRGAKERILESADALGFKIDPEAKIGQLSIGDRQRVEIIKALFREAAILILDEPTSVLTPQESEELFRLLRELIEKGLSVVFITHRLEEVMLIADRITVLRQGKKIATVAKKDTNPRELARLMVGREVLRKLRRTRTELKEEVLRVEDLRVVTDDGLVAVENVSFNVRKGEIVGIAGVVGNGQSELVAALLGLLPVRSGRIVINGKDLTNASPRAILQEGVGFIPEDCNDGLLENQPIWENIILDSHYLPSFSDRLGRIIARNAYKHAQALMERYNIKARSIHSLVRELSGGNKQKLVLARELSRRPKLLIAAHPTRGLDVGAEEYIQQQLLLGKDKGMGILLVSTKLDEIMDLSDRIIVMFNGMIMGILSRDEATIEKVGLLMAGVRD